MLILNKKHESKDKKNVRTSGKGIVLPLSAMPRRAPVYHRE